MQPLHHEANTAALMFIIAACVILATGAIMFIKTQRGSQKKPGPVD